MVGYIIYKLRVVKGIAGVEGFYGIEFYFGGGV